MGLDISVVKKETLVEMGITHNLTPMWREAGIYETLYFSDGRQVKEVIAGLSKGFADIVQNPQKYKKLNAENGWGTYEEAVQWLAELIGKMANHPEGVLEISK